MRSKRVDNRIDEQVLEKAGLSGDAVERMYRLLALARLEERFVLPTVPVKDDDIFIQQGGCGYEDAV